MTTKTCTNGHTMMGIGFGECPECEAPWTATPTDDDFEFFNLNPNPTQIHGYMTGVRNKAREEERERCKTLVVAHLRTNTYDGNDARIFKTTVEEVVGLLSDKK